jgi:hypothetical protein
VYDATSALPTLTLIALSFSSFFIGFFIAQFAQRALLGSVELFQF